MKGVKLLLPPKKKLPSKNPVSLGLRGIDMEHGAKMV